MGNCFVKQQSNNLATSTLVHRSRRGRRRRPKWFRCTFCVSASAVNVNNPLAETLLPTTVPKEKSPENISDFAIEVAAVDRNDSDDVSHIDAVRREPVEEVDDSSDDKGEDANSIDTEAGEEVEHASVTYEYGISVDDIEYDTLPTEETTTINETPYECVTDQVEYDGHIEEEEADYEFLTNQADISDYDRPIDEEEADYDVVTNQAEYDRPIEEEEADYEVVTNEVDIQYDRSIEEEEAEYEVVTNEVDIQYDGPIEEDEADHEVVTNEVDIQYDRPIEEEEAEYEVVTNQADISEYDGPIEEEEADHEVVTPIVSEIPAYEDTVDLTNTVLNTPIEEEIQTLASCSGINDEYNHANNDDTPTIDDHGDTTAADEDYISSGYPTVIYVREYDDSVGDDEASVEDSTGIKEDETNLYDCKTSSEDPTPVTFEGEITDHDEVKPTGEDTSQAGIDCENSVKDAQTTHKCDDVLHADSDTPYVEHVSPKREVNTMISIGNDQPVREKVRKKVRVNEGYFIQKQKSNHAIASVSSEIHNSISVLKNSASRRTATVSHAPDSKPNYATGLSISDIISRRISVPRVSRRDNTPRYAVKERIAPRDDTPSDSVKERIAPRDDTTSDSVNGMVPTRDDTPSNSVNEIVPTRDDTPSDSVNEIVSTRDDTPSDSVNELVSTRDDTPSDSVNERNSTKDIKERETQEARVQAAEKPHRQRDAVRVIPAGSNYNVEDKQRNDIVDMLGKGEHEDHKSVYAVNERISYADGKPKVTQEPRVLAPDNAKTNGSGMLLVAMDEASKANDVDEAKISTSIRKSGYVQTSGSKSTSESNVRDADTSVHLTNDSKPFDVHDNRVLLGNRKPKVKKMKYIDKAKVSTPSPETNFVEEARQTYCVVEARVPRSSVTKHVDAATVSSSASETRNAKVSTSGNTTRFFDDPKIPKSNRITKSGRRTKYTDEASKANDVDEARISTSSSKIGYVDEAKSQTSDSKSTSESNVRYAETAGHLTNDSKTRDVHDDQVLHGNRKHKVKMKRLVLRGINNQSLFQTGADDNEHGELGESESTSASDIKPQAAESASTDGASHPRTGLNFLEYILDEENEEKDYTAIRQKKPSRDADIETDAKDNSVDAPQTFPRGLSSQKSRGSNKGSRGRKSAKGDKKDSDNDVTSIPLTKDTSLHINQAAGLNKHSLEMVNAHDGNTDMSIEVYVRSPLTSKTRRVKLSVTTQDIKAGLVPKAFRHLNKIKKVPKRFRADAVRKSSGRKSHMYSVPDIAREENQSPTHSWIQTTGASNNVQLSRMPAYAASRPAKKKGKNIREQLSLSILKELDITVQCKQIERIKVYCNEFPGILPKSQFGMEIAKSLRGESTPD